MSAPKIGDTVIYLQHPEDAPFNGAFSHPAIVTRVWGPDCVNLTVVPDLSIPFCISSVSRVAADGAVTHSNGAFTDRV